jgi:precorrin-6A/cobalt-precorrin-6A reductase
MIIILAGTSEGRELSTMLHNSGFPVLATVTSLWGEELLKQQGLNNIVRGNLTKVDLKALIMETGANMMVDATHPFAAAISQEAMAAANASGIEYLRLERPAVMIPNDPLVIRIQQLEQLEDYLTTGLRVFSTLGSKSLAVILPIIRRKGAELTARVLPSSTVLKTCEDLELNSGQIVAMHGPFSLGLNIELFKQYRADLIISKESGSAGGLEAKIAAAQKMEIPILIWSRPQLDYPRVLDSSCAVFKYITRGQGPWPRGQGQCPSS